MGRNRSWVVRITTAECAVELRCSAGGFCCVLRFMTNGSGEKEKIIEMLDKLVG